MSDRVAQAMVIRLEELSSAALRSGAEASAIARLLESASIATLHGVSLAYLCAEPPLHEVAAPVRTLPPAAARLLDAA
jgi:hypothetical protein